MSFNGFISYSHAADGKLAPAVQRGLHRLAKPWHRRRALWIFRDQTGLSVTPGLWSSIQKALDLRTLVTHIFVRGDEFLARDSVFGVRDSLVKDFAEQAPRTPTPDGRDLGDRSWSRVRFDIVLAPA